MIPLFFFVHLACALVFEMMLFMSDKLPRTGISVVDRILEMRELEVVTPEYAFVMWMLAVVSLGMAFFNPGFFHLAYQATVHAWSQKAVVHLLMIEVWGLVFLTEIAYVAGSTLLFVLGAKLEKPRLFGPGDIYR
jgi:hypothetical protein